MRAAPAIFVSLMVLLCPALCAAELCTQQRAHECGELPGHHHDSGGEPAPHDEHTCLCTGAAAPAVGLQIPPLALAGFIAIDADFRASLQCLARADAPEQRQCGDPPPDARHAPLLI